MFVVGWGPGCGVGGPAGGFYNNRSSGKPLPISRASTPGPPTPTGVTADIICAFSQHFGSICTAHWQHLFGWYHVPKRNGPTNKEQYPSACVCMCPVRLVGVLIINISLYIIIYIYIYICICFFVERVWAVHNTVITAADRCEARSVLRTALCV